MFGTLFWEETLYTDRVPIKSNIHLDLSDTRHCIIVTQIDTCRKFLLRLVVKGGLDLYLMYNSNSKILSKFLCVFYTSDMYLALKLLYLDEVYFYTVYSIRRIVM